MYEKRFKSARFRESDGVRSSWCRCRNWSLFALAGVVALLTGCIVRHVVLGYPPGAADFPYYAGRAAVVIYSPQLDSTRVDSLYLYKRGRLK